MPALASAQPAAYLQVGHVPERPGQDTTIEFASDCSTVALRTAHRPAEAFVPASCPSRSMMVYGTATAEVNLGGKLVEASTASSWPLLAEGNINLQFFVNAKRVRRRTDLPRNATPDLPTIWRVPNDHHPLAQSTPEGSGLSLVRLHSTIGPLGVTFYEHTHGEFVPLPVQRNTLPPTCPKRDSHSPSPLHSSTKAPRPDLPPCRLAALSCKVCSVPWPSTSPQSTFSWLIRRAGSEWKGHTSRTKPTSS
jgi:hypothetical protein